MRKFELYKVVDEPAKGLILEKHNDGWYSIVKLAQTKDNVFYSIEEVETAVGHKLEFVEEEFYPDE
jgi:hypothetical protein